MARFTLSFILTLLLFKANAQIQVNNTATGLQLAQKIVGNGISISNVVFNAAVGACGIFKNASNPIGIDSGIVLTTGKCKTSGLFTIGIDGEAEDFTFGNADNDNGIATGDPQLSALIGRPVSQTKDPAILEFDFVPLGDTISFRYVFSSEEYPEFNCSDFNDVFAFFISGPGYPSAKNLALIPGTTIPVSINSINNGVAGPDGSITLCNMAGPGSPFVSLYLSNATGLNLTHNGHTRVLIVKAVVIPCQTYKLRIGIQDVFDGSLDSGVFIEANSLNSNAVKLAINAPTDPLNNIKYIAEGCVAGQINIAIPNASITPTVVNLNVSGTALNGIDYAAIPPVVTIPAGSTSVNINLTALNDAFVEGTELIKIAVSSPCNPLVFIDSITIEVRDFANLTVAPANIFSGCSLGSIPLSASAGYTTYTWASNPTLSATNIPNPIATPTTVPVTYYVTAVLGTCTAKDSVRINAPTLTLQSITQVICASSNTGSITVNAVGFAAPVRYSLNGGTPQNTPIFNNLAAGNYTIVATDANNCSLNVSTILVNLNPPITATETINAPACAASPGSIVITASGGSGSYTYAFNALPFDANNIITTYTIGANTYTVKDANNCTFTKNINIVPQSTLAFTTVVTSASCSGLPNGTVTVTATGGNTPYEYSANNGLTYQASNVLLVTNGIKNIRLKDANGCFVNNTATVNLNNNLTFNNGGSLIICEGDTKKILAASNATTFLWTPNTNISNNTLLQPTVNPTVNTTYFVTATTGICTYLDSLLVTVNPAPFANAGADSTICYGGTIALNGSGGVMYNWQPNTAINNTMAQNPLINPLQNITYSLIVTNANGCKSLQPSAVSITVTPPLIIKATNDTVVALNQPLQLNATGAPLWLWTPSSFLSSNTINTPVATFTNTFTNFVYIVKGFTPQNCFGLDTVNVKVFLKPAIYVPSAFSPNNDGRNDVLRAIPVGIKTFKYFNVYNRWGNLVFSTTNAANGWTGKINGIPQSTNTFVYKTEGLDYLNTKIFTQGTVTIIR